MTELSFVIHETDPHSSARNGRLRLAHGVLPTPAFMPVGTAATVKALHHDSLHEMGYRLILANTYHLYLRPGMETIRAFGGVHRFSTWEHNLLTDSGGYQIFSLAKLRTIRDEGVLFQSHIDGARIHLTPEDVVDVQVTIGSDIQMVLDVCTGPDVGRTEAAEALRVTSLWAERAKQRWLQHQDHYPGALFAIVQGNFYPDLRREAAERTAALDLPGIAIGGLSVGESFSQFEDTLAHTAPFLPHGVPRYVMGIGTPDLILTAVENGIDLFDCVFPTRAGRNATVFTTAGRINLRNAKWRNSDEPLDPLIDSFGGRAYSLGYLRHLFKSNEMLAAMLATEHNLRFMQWFMHRIRESIAGGTFSEFKRTFLEMWSTRRD